MNKSESKKILLILIGIVIISMYLFLGCKDIQKYIIFGTNPRSPTHIEFPDNLKKIDSQSLLNEYKITEIFPNNAYIYNLGECYAVVGDLNMDGKDDMVIQFGDWPTFIIDYWSIVNNSDEYEKSWGKDWIYNVSKRPYSISTFFIHGHAFMKDTNNDGKIELIERGGKLEIYEVRKGYYTLIFNVERDSLEPARLIDLENDGIDEVEKIITYKEMGVIHRYTVIYKRIGENFEEYYSSRGVSRLMEDLNDSFLSREQKLYRLSKIQRSLGDELTLMGLRITPIYHPEKGWMTTDSYLRELKDEVGGGEYLEGSPMDRDPLTTTFDLIQGYYSPQDFVKDHFNFEY